MRTNASITLYNKYIDPVTRSEKYQRLQLLGVVWQGSKGDSVLGKGGYIEVDKATIYIPWARGTNYLRPVAWQALSNKAGIWTLQPADFIVRGLITDEITDSFTTAALTAKYDDVYTITTVETLNVGSPALWHWRVGAG